LPLTELFFHQEGIRLALLADGGAGSVAGMHQRFVRKSHQLALERVHYLLHRTTPKVGSTDAAREERVACEKLWSGHRNIAAFVRQVEAYASWRMTGRVKHARFKRAPAQDVAFPQHLVHVGEVRRRQPDERRLHIHRVIQREILAVHHHRRARVLVQLAQPADMINVRVRAHDGFYGEFVASQEIEHAADFIARIDNQGFARHGIADDGTVAVEYPHGDGDMDQSIRGRSQRGKSFVHERDYSIGVEQNWQGCRATCRAV
jgi:hypothetical protein